MDEAGLSQQVRDTIASHSDERLLSMLEAPEGHFTAEALEYARAELRARGGEVFVAQRVRERPESPDRIVAEYPSDDDILTSAFNGCGTTFYGKRDREPDGSYVTTKWIIVVHLPIVPRGSYRLRVVSKKSGLVTNAVSYAGHPVPLNRRQVINTYVAAYGGIAALLAWLAIWG